MRTYQGKGVYGAIAIGRISVFKRQDAKVRRTHVDDASQEIARVEAAKELATQQLQ